MDGCDLAVRIVYYPAIVRAFKSYPVGIMLSYLIVRTNNCESDISLTPQDFECTGLLGNEIVAAKKFLIENSIISCTSKGRGGTEFHIYSDVVEDYLTGRRLLEEKVVVKKLKPEKKTSVVKENKIHELIKAFHSAGMETPMLVGSGNMVKSLLNIYSADEIAQCWSDILNGKFGNNWMKENLSFGYLARNDIITKWRRAKNNGSHNSLRPGEREDELKSTDKQSGGWEYIQ